ncbi:hypothetical protein PEC18_02135 [Paucibacter sp. O1-1]|nr:hypothetical protein [Paucibacter sp. O1-1]MDA3824686.1 hypothetical protein [Paucibacter sp. O1-1]
MTGSAASASVGACRCLMACLCAAALVSPALAQDLSERVALDGSVLRLSVNQGEPLATSGAAPALGPGAGTSTSARQTMVWMRPRAGALGLGLGVEQREGLLSANGGVRQAGLLLGVSLATGQRSELVLQTPLLNASRTVPEPGLASADEARQLRMGLVFDSRKPYEDLRRGVRVELSGQTTVSFKPRGGRIGVTVQSRW